MDWRYSTGMALRHKMTMIGVHDVFVKQNEAIAVETRNQGGCRHLQDLNRHLHPDQENLDIFEEGI